VTCITSGSTNSSDLWPAISPNPDLASVVEPKTKRPTRAVTTREHADVEGEEERARQWGFELGADAARRSPG